jgi:hypothetical protein
MGCDPPIAAFEKIMQKLNYSAYEQGRIDMLFLPGDFIGHSLPID